MAEIIGNTILAVVIGLFVIAGWSYIRTTKKSVKATYSVFNKQEYVKQNRTKFGVENRGTSMDGHKIFTVSPSDIGL